MKWKQPKVALAILALLTIGTLALAYQHNIDYQRYVQEITKEYEDLGINPGILDFWPWHVWGSGPLVSFLGIIIIVSWIALPIVWLKGHRNLRHKKLLVLLFVLLIPMVFSPVNIAIKFFNEHPKQSWRNKTFMLFQEY